MRPIPNIRNFKNMFGCKFFYSKIGCSLYLCVWSTVRAFLFENETLQRRPPTTRTHTHPYEHTYVKLTPMSTYEGLIRQISKFTKSPQAPPNFFICKIFETGVQHVLCVPLRVWIECIDETSTVVQPTIYVLLFQLAVQCWKMAPK